MFLNVKHTLDTLNTMQSVCPAACSYIRSEVSGTTFKQEEIANELMPVSLWVVMNNGDMNIFGKISYCVDAIPFTCIVFRRCRNVGERFQ